MDGGRGVSFVDDGMLLVDCVEEAEAQAIEFARVCSTEFNVMIA